jgi:large subunit ribosomal protein L9
MELLLKQTIEHLGRVGEVVKVKAGYARNYLLPMGLAIHVTKANLAVLERERSRIAAEEAERVQAMRDMVAKMKDVSVTIESKANEQNHLFGSVGASQIAAALREKGYQVDDRAVRLEAPIREIGDYTVPLHLHADLQTTVRVWVVAAKPR